MTPNQTDDVIEGYRVACKKQGDTITELRDQMRHMVRLDDPVVTGLVEAAKAASHGNYPALGQRNASNRLCQKAISAYEAQVKSIELQNHGHIEIDYWHNNETTTMSPSRVKEVGK